MALLHISSRQHQQKLEKFRQSFLLLIADGRYPPDRQSRLYQACVKIGLDWEEARLFVVPEALGFMHTLVSRVIADGQISAAEIGDLRRFQRRFGLGDEHAWPVLTRVYDLVERRLEALIIEKAAYLSSVAVIPLLQEEIRAYDLPLDRQLRLLHQVDRQHALAMLMAGTLPVVAPTVELYRDELCHLDIPVTFILDRKPAKLAAGGKLIATSQRLLLLAANDGFTAPWIHILLITPKSDSVEISAPAQSGVIYSKDSRYLATLLVATRKKYTPAAEVAPKRANKRLRNSCH